MLNDECPIAQVGICFSFSIQHSSFSIISSMSSCCQTTSQPASAAGTLTVALAGNPNSGKTTIFNCLTGLRQKVANYPGVTVEKKIGRCKLPHGRWCEVIDLPGTYSMISRSPDEQVAMEVLRGIRKDVARPDIVVVV